MRADEELMERARRLRREKAASQEETETKRAASPAPNNTWDYADVWNGAGGGTAIRERSWKSRIRGPAGAARRAAPAAATAAPRLGRASAPAPLTTAGAAVPKPKPAPKPAPSPARSAAVAALGGSATVRQTRQAAEWVLKGTESNKTTPSTTPLVTPRQSAEVERSHAPPRAAPPADQDERVRLNARPPPSPSQTAPPTGAARTTAATVVAAELPPPPPPPPPPEPVPLEPQPEPPAAPMDTHVLHAEPVVPLMPMPRNPWADDAPVMEAFKSMSVGFSDLPAAPAAELSTPSVSQAASPEECAQPGPVITPFNAHASDDFVTARTRLRFVPGPGAARQRRRVGASPSSPPAASSPPQPVETGALRSRAAAPLSPSRIDAGVPSTVTGRAGVGVLVAFRDFLEHPVAAYLLPHTPRMLYSALVSAALVKGREIAWADVAAAYRTNVPRSAGGIGSAASATSLALALVLSLCFLAAAASSALLLTTSFLAFAIAAAMSAALALFSLVVASASWSLGLVGGAVGCTTAFVVVGQRVLSVGSRPAVQ